MQEHADDDLQVDGPGETDTEADVGDDVGNATSIHPPAETDTTVASTASTQKDSAQIAKKIKEIIGQKAGITGSKRLVVEESETIERSASNESVKTVSTRSASPSSVSGI